MVRTVMSLIGLVAVVSANCEAQTGGPAVKVYAYERQVVGGAPGGPPTRGGAPLRSQYAIYVETAPNAAFSVDGVWMSGKYYSARAAVKGSPVRFDTPVALADASKNVAVPATTNTVTEIVVGDPVSGKTADASVANALADNQAVVQVTYQGRSVLIPIKKFEKGAPAFLP